MVDFIKLDYHLEDLDRALTMMSSLLNSMVEEMETEFTDIRAKVKSISEGVEVADTIEIAAIKNRLIEIKYELIAVDILSQKIENRRNNLWLEFDFTYMDFSVRAYSALRRAGYKTLGELLALTPKKLMSIKNLGKASYNDITTKLKEYGFHLKDEDTTPTGGH